LAASRKPFNIFLRIHSYSVKSGKVSVGLDTPDGFTSSAPVELSFDGVGDQYAKLTVTPPAKLAPGNFTIAAYAKRGDENSPPRSNRFPPCPPSSGANPRKPSSTPSTSTSPPTSASATSLPKAKLIPKHSSASASMSKCSMPTPSPSAISPNTPPSSSASALTNSARNSPAPNKRLLDYVTNGGTLVVQYNRDFIWSKFLPAPYHATIGNPTPRITDETAKVKFLKPDEPAAQHPQQNHRRDFQNWVQERGLYYWSDFDAKYTPLPSSMHDPGEKDLNGGLVYTHLGKGVYIYTGLAFFRELPKASPAPTASCQSPQRLASGALTRPP